jgi:hypothetical protein
VSGWYVEVYSPEGTRIWAKDGHTHEQTVALIEQREEGQTVRFIAPRDADVNQMLRLEALGAMRTA